MRGGFARVLPQFQETFEFLFLALEPNVRPIRGLGSWRPWPRGGHSRRAPVPEPLKIDLKQRLFRALEQNTATASIPLQIAKSGTFAALLVAPVTPEVTGSSPVAPVFLFTLRIGGFCLRFVD